VTPDERTLYAIGALGLVFLALAWLRRRWLRRKK
jgi:hypothetical protein